MSVAASESLPWQEVIGRWAQRNRELCCVLLVAAIFLLEVVKHKSGGRVLPPVAEPDKKRE